MVLMYDNIAHRRQSVVLLSESKLFQLANYLWMEHNVNHTNASHLVTPHECADVVLHSCYLDTIIHLVLTLKKYLRSIDIIT